MHGLTCIHLTTALHFPSYFLAPSCFHGAHNHAIWPNILIFYVYGGGWWFSPLHTPIPHLLQPLEWREPRPDTSLAERRGMWDGSSCWGAVSTGRQLPPICFSTAKGPTQRGFSLLVGCPLICRFLVLSSTYSPGVKWTTLRWRSATALIRR